MDSASLFTRLNVGRIPLTNAELVKAMLLGKSRERASSDVSASVAISAGRRSLLRVSGCGATETFPTA